MAASEAAVLTRSNASPRAIAAEAQSSPSERLRRLGIECAAAIAADSESWIDAATWLRSLPMCWAIVEKRKGLDLTDDDGEPWLIVGLDDMPVKPDGPPSHQFFIYDNESVTNRIQGPILRRLVTGWNAASHRFLHREREDDRYYDFCLDDARRITLLAALTLNRDFDGTVVGLNYPWEPPAECSASFEGRGWAWSSLTCGHSADVMLELIETATDYLRRLTPSIGLATGGGYPIGQDDRMERKADGISPTRARARGAKLAESTYPHPGDDLLRFLAAQPDELAPIQELPERLRDPNALTVSDADGLIEFGSRNHFFVGPHHELCVESGWNFGSITGPDRKPMRTFIAEAMDFDSDDRIRPHVRLTADGRIRAARLTAGSNGQLAAIQPAKEGTDWRDVQRRLSQKCDRGELYTSFDDLALQLDCSKSTISKAMNPGKKTLATLDMATRNEVLSVSRRLLRWKSGHKKGAPAPSASSLAEPVIEKVKQTRESNPAVEAEDADWAVEFARLIQDVEPDERAQLNAMSDDRKRELMVALREDPDNYDRIMGRKP